MAGATDRAGKIVCVGEAMVVLTPAHDVPLHEAAEFVRTIGGAELNVALTLAGLGVPTAWLSRLGEDGFGRHVAAVATEAGVDDRPPRARLGATPPSCRCWSTWRRSRCSFIS